MCVVLVGIVLIQQGRNSDVGSTFGGGGNTLFGAGGADTFLTKLTTIVAAVFMLTSLTLAINQQRGVFESHTQGTIFDDVPATSAPAETGPADPAAGAGALPQAGAGTTPPSSDTALPTANVPATNVPATNTAP